MPTDLAKLIFDIATVGQPHDAARCKRCLHQTHDTGGYCYMWREEPTSLCQKFKEKQ